MAVRHPILVVWIMLWSLYANGSPPASGLKMIAHPSIDIDEISMEELRSIFLGTTTTIKKGAPVTPVLSREDGNLNHFASAYLGKTTSALETYYRSLMFTGKWSMPLGFASDAKVVDYVAKTPGAIGFVRDTTRADQVKTLRIR